MKPGHGSSERQLMVAKSKGTRNTARWQFALAISPEPAHILADLERASEDTSNEDTSNQRRARWAQRARRAAGARGHHRRAGRVRLQGISHGRGERVRRSQQDHDLSALAQQGVI